nr:uncharacterized protein ndufv3 isoform X5 [Syngnathus scovelli]
MEDAVIEFGHGHGPSKEVEEEQDITTTRHARDKKVKKDEENVDRYIASKATMDIKVLFVEELGHTEDLHVSVVHHSDWRGCKEHSKSKRTR